MSINTDSKFVLLSLTSQMKLGSPDMSVIKFIQKIAWSAGGGHLNLLHATNEEIHKTYEKEKVSFHCLTL